MPETTADLLPRDTVLHIRDTCLCLAAQRAARRLARRFDAALRPFGLTNGQFSLMVALNQPEPPPIGRLAPFLGMDPSTLTAAVKPLARRGLLTVEPDPDDRRSRRLRITSEGVALMRQAVEVWQAEHAALEARMGPGMAARLREALAPIGGAGVA
jgi:DNA-binding MarR family transcriptional regulator